MFNLEKKLRKKLDKNNITECEKCNCLIFKEFKNQGESKIIKVKYYDLGAYAYISERKEREEIKETYYCKNCKPKK